MSLKVFVATGTHEQPFNRLIEMAIRVEQIGGVEVRVQFGSSAAPLGLDPTVMCCDFLPANEMNDWFKWSDICFSQASPGIVFSALENGSWPIVTGRLSRLREHVDDHQVKFARIVGELGLGTEVVPFGDYEAVILDERNVSSEARLSRTERAWEQSQARTQEFVKSFSCWLSNSI